MKSTQNEENKECNRLEAINRCSTHTVTKHGS